MPPAYTILVCPLNWGLGHASRDICIIRRLLRYGHRVVIGGDKSALSLLISEFPGLPSVRVPDVSIRYSRFLPAWIAIMIQLPVIIYNIIREHYLLKSILIKVQADMIISDNRYGLWNKGVTSILISHQLSPRLPALLRPMEPALSLLISLICRPFDFIWVPDIPGSFNLSGSLSHPFRSYLKMRHIGILSRFRDIIVPGDQPEGYELLIILSGPEPQRTILQELLVSQTGRFPGRTLIIAGEIHKTYSRMVSRFCRVVSGMNTNELLMVIYSARYVICRSGYSGIMEIASLRKKALLVPTPGQTEQEYLARHLQSAGLFPFMKQQEFDIARAINILEHFSFRSIDIPDGLFDSALSEATGTH